MSVSPLRFFVAGGGVVDTEVFNALATFASLDSEFIRGPPSSEFFPHSLFTGICSKFGYGDTVVSGGPVGVVELLARIRFPFSDNGISVTKSLGETLWGLDWISVFVLALDVGH